MDDIAIVNAYNAMLLIRKNIKPGWIVTMGVEPHGLISDRDELILTSIHKLLRIRFAMRFKPEQVGQQGADKAMAEGFLEKFVESGKRKGYDGRTR